MVDDGSPDRTYEYGATGTAIENYAINSSTSDKVFKDTLSGSLVGSWTIDAANKSPTGLTIDPTGASQSIWIVDSGTDKVYEYTGARAKTPGSQSAANTGALAAGNTNPQGIADPPPAGSPVNSAAGFNTNCASPHYDCRKIFWGSNARLRGS